MLLRKKLTARRLLPPSPQSFIQELTNWTCKSTKTSHVNPANRKIHSQALVVVMWMWVLWICVLKKQKGDFGTALFFFFFQSIVAWSLQSSCLIKRNTIFNTTIQKKPFSSTLLKKKPGKLKREKEKSPSLGEGKRGRRNKIPENYKWTNFYTPRSHENHLGEERSPLCTQLVRRLGKAWGGKGAWREAKGRFGSIFLWDFFFKDFLFFIYFIFLALKIPEGISLLFMPRLLKKKKNF